ncbi:MAG: MaoC family dehydratase N-terminal domain-containing protein [Micromonosporaceae bacterium]|nr:MaoC family dehydratase N-terminal domain-containing protein [Micromonosporaceae bacterium]
MPLNPSYVGRSFPPSQPYLVGREKIREFARAIGATDPAYLDTEAAKALGHPDLVAPPTFPVIVAMAATRALIDDPDLGLDYSRVVHGDERFGYVRPVRAGDELTCVVTVEEITSRAGNDFITTRTEVGTVDGEPVVTVWSKLVVRGSAGGAGGAGDEKAE